MERDDHAVLLEAAEQMVGREVMRQTDRLCEHHKDPTHYESLLDNRIFSVWDVNGGRVEVPLSTYCRLDVATMHLTGVLHGWSLETGAKIPEAAAEVYSQHYANRKKLEDAFRSGMWDVQAELWRRRE